MNERGAPSPRSRKIEADQAAYHDDTFVRGVGWTSDKNQTARQTRRLIATAVASAALVGLPIKTKTACQTRRLIAMAIPSAALVGLPIKTKTRGKRTGLARRKARERKNLGQPPYVDCATERRLETHAHRQRQVGCQIQNARAMQLPLRWAMTFGDIPLLLHSTSSAEIEHQLKNLFSVYIALLIPLGTMLTSCGEVLTGTSMCRGGVCVYLEVMPPILLNESVPVTITVRTQQDIHALEIYLVTLPSGIVVEGERHWTIDAKTNREITVNSQIKFTEEGNREIFAQAHDTTRGLVVTNSQRIWMTRAGGTVNPPTPQGTRSPPVAITLTPGLPR